MDEISNLFAEVIFEAVQTTKDVKGLLTNRIAQSDGGDVVLTFDEAKGIDGMLRINIDLVSRLFEQNSEILDRARTLLAEMKAMETEAQDIPGV